MVSVSSGCLCGSSTAHGRKTVLYAGKKCLAVIWALEHFQPYVEGLHMTVLTDHNSLKWLMSLPNPTGSLAWWSLRLQNFDFTILYKEGVYSRVPDALSRNPLLSPEGPPIEILPEHAVIWGMNLRSELPILLEDRTQLR